MSEAKARDEADRLRTIMAKHGVKCSLALLRVGRPNVDGSDWYTRKYVSMNHHTATAAGGDTPTLSLCVNGRSDLPGPLCNGYGGRDLIYRVVTMGLANHPGEGGPLTVAGFTIPKDSARISTWGTEWEHNGISAWSPEMVDFMTRSNAALLEWMGRPPVCSIEHKTWAPDRKIDRRPRYALDGSTGAADVRRYLATLEDDVTDQDKLDIIDGVWTRMFSPSNSPTNAPMQAWVAQTNIKVDKLQADIDAIKAKLGI